MVLPLRPNYIQKYTYVHIFAYIIIILGINGITIMSQTIDMNELFKPAQSGRAVEDIALQLEAAITSGEIAPGDRLPSERQLQLLFKTGRGVIREAMRILKQKDLVEIKKGAKGGAFVKQLPEAGINDSLALFLKQYSVAPESVIEFRESMDRTIILLAISRGSREEKKILYSRAEEFNSYVSSPDASSEKIGEMDRELNTLLARLTGNPVFEWVMNSIQLGFSSYDYALYEDLNYRMKTGLNWANTAGAILEGEPMRALAFAANHYNLLRECLNEKKETMTSPEISLTDITPDTEGEEVPDESDNIISIKRGLEE